MYKTRIKILIAIIAATLLILVVRLVDLQLIHGEDYRRQYERTIRDTQILQSSRGRILDRAGRILAVDNACKNFCLDYRFITAKPSWVARQIRKIARTQGVDKLQAERIYRRRERYTWALAGKLAEKYDTDLAAVKVDTIKNVQRILASVRRRRKITEIREQRQFHPMVIGLDEKTWVAVEARLHKTVGADVRASHKRYYPYKRLACHIIGVTGEVSQAQRKTLNAPWADADWPKRMQNRYALGEVIGKFGVEKMSENNLRGRRGYRVRSRQPEVTDDLEHVPARGGADVQLTLDIQLQRRIGQTFAALSPNHNGAVVVLSLPRGEVLAMVSVPGYDLNGFRSNFRKIYGDQLNYVYLNRAIARRYPIGSTAKPFSALAALSEGVLVQSTSYNCIGRLFEDLPGKWQCWNRYGHGYLDLIGSIRQSCNIYYYKIGELLGGDIRQWFARFGFGDVPGTGLPEERPGLIPTDDWLTKHKKPRFNPRGEGRLMAIGQGIFEATPMHVANAMATIARGGLLLPPTLVRGQDSSVDGVQIPLDPSHIEAVQRGMYEVVEATNGSAYKYFHGSDVIPLGFEICGKTGTAQTSPQVIKTKGGRKLIRRGDMAWFAGFAPYKNPQIAIAVVVEYVVGGSGGKNAGPIARETLRLCEEFGYLD